MFEEVIPVSKNLRPQTVLNAINIFSNFWDKLTSACDRFLYMVIYSIHATAGIYSTYTATCRYKLTSGKHVILVSDVDFRSHRRWNMTGCAQKLLLVNFYGRKSRYTLLTMMVQRRRDLEDLVTLTKQSRLGFFPRWT